MEPLVYLHDPEQMMLVRYEDFLAAKVQIIEGIGEQLGLPRVNDIPGSVDIQYQPRGDHSVSLLEFFWPDHLAMIEEIAARR